MSEELVTKSPKPRLAPGGTEGDVALDRPEEPLYVTRPSLPPLEEFIPYLERMWESKILTNMGQMHREFERALADYLGVEHIALFNNGTVALLTALKAMKVTGEVITTPYSFVATAHSLLWNGLTPTFVDIDPSTLNLDPARIEMAITRETSAILPVHCYGTPCEVDGIQEIADKYGLTVIYDAAHAFGVRDVEGSILRHGDLSVLSFHATKVFNTFEGGAIVCPDAKTKKYVDYLKNFGFADETTVVAGGINGKMTEVCAAFGLLQLEYVDREIEARRRIAERYRSELSNVRGISLLEPTRGLKSAAFGYFPLLIEEDYPLRRDELYLKMRRHEVFTRRYFFPLISNFPMYRSLPSADSSNLPVAEEIARQILCLPIYSGLSDDQVDRVLRILR